MFAQWASVAQHLHSECKLWSSLISVVHLCTVAGLLSSTYASRPPYRPLWLDRLANAPASGIGRILAMVMESDEEWQQSESTRKCHSLFRCQCLACLILVRSIIQEWRESQPLPLTLTNRLPVEIMEHIYWTTHHTMSRHCTLARLSALRGVLISSTLHTTNPF